MMVTWSDVFLYIFLFPKGGGGVAQQLYIRVT
jgi:hypothetical protein